VHETPPPLDFYSRLRKQRTAIFESSSHENHSVLSGDKKKRSKITAQARCEALIASENRDSYLENTREKNRETTEREKKRKNNWFFKTN
jgi:hypothetical protein